jgi:hypothetical protein
MHLTREGIVTDDHVPPQCLAPKANDSIFYKLPAHESCNKAFSVQESRFRDYVVAYATDGVQEAEAAFENMLRNFGRGKEERGGLPNKDFYRLYNNVVLKEGYTPGGIYIGPVIAIRPPEDLDYKSVLIKIARGLHYYHNHEIIPANYDMNADFVVSNEEKHIGYIRQLNIAGQMGDFFAYKGTWARDEPKSGIWYMCFYRSLTGMVGFRKPKALFS